MITEEGATYHIVDVWWLDEKSDLMEESRRPTETRSRSRDINHWGFIVSSLIRGTNTLSAHRLL